jgi:hypothetical protein
VVFNDLDWVTANHWQAQGRAYRIGQTGTVNITYMVGANSVDEFVQQVLETKTRLVDPIVQGKLSADPGAGNILDELERLFYKAIAAVGGPDITRSRSGRTRGYAETGRRCTEAISRTAT